MFKTRITWQTELPSPAWENLAEDYEHLFFMDGDLKLYSFIDLAVRHNITVNDAYLARSNPEAISINKENEKEYLLGKGPKNNMVYIFPNEEQASLFRNTGLHFFLVDGIIIGIHEKKNYLAAYPTL